MGNTPLHFFLLILSPSILFALVQAPVFLSA